MGASNVISIVCIWVVLSIILKVISQYIGPTILIVSSRSEGSNAILELFWMFMVVI